jgi:geranylgeranyl diphosphate synthase type II
VDFLQKQEEYAEHIEAALQDVIPVDTVSPLGDAMRYSLLGGGKRLRPTLCLAANALLDGDRQEALPIACALEMIHTYSLIHDDLPAMDNDTLRRGKPTCHVVFGEAMAILAGDGLLSCAFDTLLGNAARYPENMQAHIAAACRVSRGAGIGGMVAGQCLDIEAEGRILEETELYAIHRLKTGAMISAALDAGLLLCNPASAEREAVAVYGENLGLAFQIVDDILDVVGQEEALGKSIGKDREADKLTFPKLYGMDKSRALAKERTEQAQEALRGVFFRRADFLCELARRQLERDR